MVDLRKQKNKTKNSTHRFLGIATNNTCAKFQGKKVNPTLVGAPGSLCFLNKRHCFLQRTSLCQYQYFSVQNQYNQTITKFVVKSNIQDIHKPQQNYTNTNIICLLAF